MKTLKASTCCLQLKSLSILRLSILLFCLCFSFELNKKRFLLIVTATGSLAQNVTTNSERKYQKEKVKYKIHKANLLGDCLNSLSMKQNNKI